MFASSVRPFALVLPMLFPLGRRGRRIAGPLHHLHHHPAAAALAPVGMTHRHRLARRPARRHALVLLLVLRRTAVTRRGRFGLCSVLMVLSRSGLRQGRPGSSRREDQGNDELTRSVHGGTPSIVPALCSTWGAAPICIAP
jgi:hypothetical protein